MLQSSKAYSGFAVDDLGAARAFYGGTLGLEVIEVDPDSGVLELRTGADRNVVMYQSGTFTPGSATILNFPVDDLDCLELAPTDAERRYLARRLDEATARS